MRLILLKLLLLLSLPVSAQLYGQAGVHISSMRNTGPIEISAPYVGAQLGVGFDRRLSPMTQLRIGVGFNYQLQGYEQRVATKEFILRMFYVQVPVYAAYPITKGIQAEVGGYAAGLARARLVYPGHNLRARENYRDMDYGLVAGLVFFEKKLVNLFLRYQHSLRPQLVYPEFAASGEEVGTYRLLQPYALTAGIRINFWKHDQF